MNRTAYIFVPGILNLPSSAAAWTDRAVTWVHLNQPGQVAEKFEYLALPLSRRFGARRRAANLVELMQRYPIGEFSLVLAGHSNGCDVILRALRLSDRPANFVHLFAPAIPSDPRRHRLSHLLRDGRIGFLNVHVAGRDRVLAARYLGGVKAEAVAAQFAGEHHTTVHSEPTFGHGTWWRPANFDAAMKSICGPSGRQP